MAQPSYKHVRSQSLDWEDDPDIPGFRQKMLNFDDATKAVVRLWFIPPDWGKDVFGGKPDRHYHKSAVECGFHLYGDFPHWEFNSVDDFDGDLYVFKRGIFMNRPPGSLHGLLPEPRSQAGAVILYWVTGPGASIKDPEFPKETVNVAFDKEVKVDINAFTPCTITQTEDLEWQAHPDEPEWKIKALADAAYDADSVNLVHIPTDWQASDIGAFDVAVESEKPWLYVVHGDLRVTVGDTDLKLVQDDFLMWSTDAPLLLPEEPLSDVGCTVLCSGHRLAGSKV